MLKRHLLHVLLYVYNNNYTSYVYLFSQITRTNLHTLHCPPLLYFPVLHVQ
jgi:hypothetical protein